MGSVALFNEKWRYLGFGGHNGLLISVFEYFDIRLHCLLALTLIFGDLDR